MANTLELHRNGAVGFIDWLGQEARASAECRRLRANAMNGASDEDAPSQHPVTRLAIRLLLWKERLISVRPHVHWMPHDKAKNTPDQSG